MPFFLNIQIRNQTYQVAIVGGGPVGLFLAICLHHAGISCIILEKRVAPITHSRSIGIHPVSLEAFKEVGLADRFIAEGIKIEEGIAFFNRTRVGTLSFKSCPPPFPFLITLPQYKTEQLLADHLTQKDPAILQRNATVTGIHQHQDYATVEFDQNGHQKQLQAAYVVGCDGKHSVVRQSAGITFSEKRYDDTYIMGDFTDNTSLGNAAAIFICDNGLIESFPLATNKRRWVIKTDHYIDQVQRHDIETRLSHRIGHNLSGTENFMLSSFRVQKGLAGRMASERIILAGDAAHVVSPIGGQGMNLGWLDARDLTRCFVELFDDKSSCHTILKNYSKRRLKIARKSARRAEFNMAMGRNISTPFIRKMLLKAVVSPPLNQLMARLFTMRGLGSYII